MSTLNSTILPQKYKIERATHRLPDKSFILHWRELLKSSQSPERIYQTPEFFDYILHRDDSQNRPELVTVVSEPSGKILGVIPIRFRKQQLSFQVGSRHFASFTIPCIVLLGSVPLLPEDASLIELLLQFLNTEFPEYRAISLPALPADSSFWADLQALEKFRRNYSSYLLHDWRDCHRISLPADFETYLQQFSSKRRYNLKRQIRLLREHSKGRLDLHCIQKPEQVASLSRALDKLAPDNLRAQLLSDAALCELARRGLLLCYVMECYEQPCALILGTCSMDILHLHNILHDAELTSLSVGTSILQMAIQDLCDNKHFVAIDFGYGTPTHKYESSNITMRRGHMLILRPNLRNFIECSLHKMHCGVVDLAKRIMHQARRRTSVEQRGCQDRDASL